MRCALRSVCQFENCLPSTILSTNGEQTTRTTYIRNSRIYPTVCKETILRRAVQFCTSYVMRKREETNCRRRSLEGREELGKKKGATYWHCAIRLYSRPSGHLPTDEKTTCCLSSYVPNGHNRLPGANKSNEQRSQCLTR